MSSAQSDQATYYRTALLLGLVDGGTVHEWARQLIEGEANPPSLLVELISVDPTDLSALRHALWPLVIEPDPPAVIQSLFARLGSDLTAGRRGMTDTIIVLRQMRSMLKLPPDIYAGLNAALVAQTREGQDDAVARWLGQFDDAGLDVSI